MVRLAATVSANEMLMMSASAAYTTCFDGTAAGGAAGNGASGVADITGDSITRSAS
ncbi:hypothetical protein D3C83_219680 [compost metagenome]